MQTILQIETGIVVLVATEIAALAYIVGTNSMNEKEIEVVDAHMAKKIMILRV